MKLNERQIEFGFNYYFKEEADQIKSVVEVSEYTGEEKLSIHCTQLGDTFTPKYKTSKDKKRVVLEWCDFLQNNPECFTELYFVSKMPQEIFDAVCSQKNLRRLEIKWGSYKDLSAIEQLQKLELLSIGSGASVESIKPLTRLSNLTALGLENFQKIDCYDELSQLKQLESLSIYGNGFAPKYISILNIDFISQLNQLRLFRLLTERLQSKDYTPILKLNNLEHLSLSSNQQVIKIYDELLNLPKLKWGFIKSNPAMYRKNTIAL
jgi:hypothetical protein